MAGSGSNVSSNDKINDSKNIAPQKSTHKKLVMQLSCIAVAIVGAIFFWNFVFRDTESWTLVGGDSLNGSWSSKKHDRVRAIEIYQDKIHVGLGYNGAELYRLDGSEWENITGPWIAKSPSRNS